MTRPGIEPRISGPLANILLIRPIVRLNNVQRSIYYKTQQDQTKHVNVRGAYDKCPDFFHMGI